jgi:hypothetical protein
MSVVEYLQDVLAGLSRLKKNIALLEEYKGAIAVLEGRMLSTSGKFPNRVRKYKFVCKFNF